ncbi:hypothetical protein E2542_SST04780 [Spatholobus suberectus]|nr:hypothetical protein E2542_SST04780 [Spatholobus suberectus]
MPSEWVPLPSTSSNPFRISHSPHRPTHHTHVFLLPNSIRRRRRNIPKLRHFPTPTPEQSQLPPSHVASLRYVPPLFLSVIGYCSTQKRIY